MQRKFELVNQRRRPEEQILLCLGLGYGDVLRVGGTELWGAEVNAASKLGEDIAKSGEILATGAMKDAATEMPALSPKISAAHRPARKGQFSRRVLSYPPQNRDDGLGEGSRKLEDCGLRCDWESAEPPDVLHLAQRCGETVLTDAIMSAGLAD